MARAAAVAAAVLCVGPGFAAADPAADPLSAMTAVHRWDQWQRVNAIAQTADGTLWLGTDMGLVRFDGAAFRILTREETRLPPGTEVSALLVRADGNLWASLTRGGVFNTADPTAAYGIPDASQATNRVNCLYEDGGRTLWLGTERGLWQLAGTAYVEIKEVAVPVRAIGRDRRGRIWLGTPEGLIRRDQDRFVRVGPRDPIAAMANDATGVLHAAGARGILRIDGDEPKALATVPRQPVETLMFDHQGALWFSSDRAVVRVGGDPIRMGGAAPAALFEDHEGSIWVGSSFGPLVQLARPMVRNFFQPDSGQPLAGFAVLADPDDGIWAVVGAGIMRVKHGQETFLDKDGSGFPAYCPRSLALGPDGTLWIATCDQGLVSYRHGTFASHGKPPELADPGLQSVHVTGAGQIFVAPRLGGLWVFDGKSFAATTFPTRPCEREPQNAYMFDMCPSAIVAMADRRFGGMWIATRGDGLYLLADGRYRKFGITEGLTTSNLLALYEEDDRTLWMATAGQGVARLRDGRIQMLDERNGLPWPSVHGIADDQFGRLWMSSDIGVFAMRKADVEAVLAGQRSTAPAYRYASADGMSDVRGPRATPPQMARSRDGRIWVPTMRGITAFRPLALDAIPAPRVYIDEVRANGAPVAWSAGGGIGIAAGTQLDVRFSANSFYMAHRLRFRYQLDGYDRQWIEAVDGRTARYGTLPAGNFRFRVEARHDDQEWTAAIASMAVVVRAPYRRYAIIAAIIFGLGLLGFFVHRVRLRLVRARFATILEDRNRIARDLHDSLAQHFTGLGYQLDRLSREVEKNAPAARALTESAREMVQQAREEARHTVWNLRMQDFKDYTLSELIQEMIRDLPFSTEIAIGFSGVSADVGLTATHKEQLSQIAREACVNAAAHGKPGRIDVSLRAAPGGLALRIEDDGIGIPAAGDRGTGGLGLIGMRERAHKMGATLTISARPGGGTVVECHLALREQKHG